ncbi:MmgE/PrpD family protein [Pseudochelatococcus lubricantis]|uniref:MmgE/PrpD family protein n=1 Tax=Pseudochelatococcus lubricantis TaxID=1538102 RepID=UPI0035EAEFA9
MQMAQTMPQETAISATDQVSDFVHGLISVELPADVQQFTVERMLDTLGVAVGARHMPHVDATLRTVEWLESAGNATIYAADRKVSVLDAMLVNGVMAHGIDFDDTHAFIHPGAAVIPAALALGERLGVSGDHLIRAVVAGYEIAVRASLAGGLAHRSRGYHPTGTCNVFGAAAAAAVLLELPADRITQAFGIAGSMVAGIVQYRDDGAATKHLHAGLAARSGVLAALLARDGLHGPGAIFEGRFGFLAIMADLENLHEMTHELGKDYAFLRTETKLYPMCRQTNSALDLAHELVDDHGVKPDQVESLTVRVTDYVMNGSWFTTNEPPPNILKARINFPYGIAATLVHGRLLEAHFAADMIIDPRVLELMRRITVIEGKEQTRRWPPERGAQIDCVLKDGRTVTLVARNPKGSVSRPLEVADLRSKFDGLVKPVLGDDRAARLADEIMALRTRPDLAALSRALA